MTVNDALLKAADAIHVHSFDKKNGTFNGPDTFYAGIRFAELLVRNLAGQTAAEAATPERLPVVSHCGVHAEHEGHEWDGGSCTGVDPCRTDRTPRGAAAPAAGSARGEAEVQHGSACNDGLTYQDGPPYICQGECLEAERAAAGAATDGPRDGEVRALLDLVDTLSTTLQRYTCDTDAERAEHQAWVNQRTASARADLAAGSET